MCENKFHKLFFQKLKELDNGGARKFADITLKILEGSDPSSHEGTEKKSNCQWTDAVRTKIVKTHKTLLYISSPYFENLLNNQAEATKFEVTVKEGQGRLLEILISWFYDEDVLVRRSRGGVCF